MCFAHEYKVWPCAKQAPGAAGQSRPTGEAAPIPQRQAYPPELGDLN